MNTEFKWHKATGPAFATGEQWFDSSTRRVSVVSVRKYPGAVSEKMTDYGVTYESVERGVTKQYEKDAWNFQIQYTRVADVK